MKSTIFLIALTFVSVTESVADEVRLSDILEPEVKELIEKAEAYKQAACFSIRAAVQAEDQKREKGLPVSVWEEYESYCNFDTEELLQRRY